MATSPHRTFRDALRARVRDLYGSDVRDVTCEFPPKLEFGDLATPLAFELARSLRRKPRAIAEEIVSSWPAIAGIDRVECAGGGYINAFFDRPALVRMLLDDLGDPHAPTSGSEKVIVEHTNINPNKAAHIGHLRNAVLGDTLVRILRRAGHHVEVQNYIDDTGVQVADLVVGFVHLLGLTSVDQILPLVRKEDGGAGRIDYYCWDLYARVTALYQERPELAARRGEVLHAMEEGDNPTAALAAGLADRVVHCHLATMERIGVRYDLLPRESDILHLHFWARAFELLRDRGAVRLAADGKNAGCWVMDLSDDPEFADIEDTQKVLVRSNGTVTYTGKDIAYQLWKFGLLGRDFRYRRYHTDPEGHVLWASTSGEGEPGAPAFGGGSRVYNVIDSRQAYPQKVVAKGLACLGFTEQAERSHHFAYEMVALTPACATELGMELMPDDRERPYVEMSGRRGLGVKADDLLDRLLERAREEVARRNPEMEAADLDAIAGTLAVGALRYFMLRFTRNRVIAFDFGEVLSFEGETGPYVQYSVVRANNILRKLAERDGVDLETLAERAEGWLGAGAPQPPAEEWGLARECARLGEVVADSVEKCEMSGIARHAFTLAQTFNNFYHRFPVLAEEDLAARRRRILLVELFRRTMGRALGLMGVEVPPRM